MSDAEDDKDTGDIPEGAKAAASAAAGGFIGYGAISISGMTAVGMVGGGTGAGMAAGPVGAVVGALGGLALYGAYSAWRISRVLKGK